MKIGNPKSDAIRHGKRLRSEVLKNFVLIKSAKHTGAINGQCSWLKHVKKASHLLFISMQIGVGTVRAETFLMLQGQS